MAHQPAPRVRGIQQPAAGRFRQHGGVVLADVVEVVGHRAAHIEFRVVLQQLQQGEHGARVLLECTQARRPGQARAGALRHQAAHMHVGVRRPSRQARQRGCGMALQKRADAELGSETLRQHVLGVHRNLKVVQAITRNETDVGQVKKRGKAAALDRVGWPADGLQQHRHCRWVVAGQMAVQRMCDVPAARHQVQRLITVQRITHEGLRVEGRPDRDDRPGDAGGDVDAELVLEGFSHGRWVSKSAGWRAENPRHGRKSLTCSASKRWQATRLRIEVEFTFAQHPLLSCTHRETCWRL